MALVSADNGRTVPGHYRSGTPITAVNGAQVLSHNLDRVCFHAVLDLFAGFGLPHTYESKACRSYRGKGYIRSGLAADTDAARSIAPMLAFPKPGERQRRSVLGMPVSYAEMPIGTT
jgi:hypothetical protein